MTIELPWPPKELSPNARIHHFTKAKAVKLYRDVAYWTVIASEIRTDPNLYDRWGDSEIILRFDFHPPDKRKRDLDNMLASCKALCDGLADALEVNDQRFGFILKRGEPIKGGLVRVRVEAGE